MKQKNVYNSVHFVGHSLHLPKYFSDDQHHHHHQGCPTPRTETPLLYCLPCHAHCQINSVAPTTHDEHMCAALVKLSRAVEIMLAGTRIIQVCAA
jgi:hypothetical protein